MSLVVNEKKLSAVVFDFDGTLVDSFNLMIDIFYNQIKQRIPEVTIEEILPIAQEFLDEELKEGMKNPKKLVLKVFYKISRALNLGRSTSANITLRTAFQIQRRYNQIEVFPNAEELLKILNESGVPTILITLSSKKHVLEILKKNDLEQYFQIIIDKNDIENFEKSKGIEDSLMALGIDKSDMKNVIALGDLPSDIRDGKSAGVKTGALLTGPLEASKLIRSNPDYIFADLNDVLTIFKRDFTS
jgi:phosphoglycolate phosphatase-like HAD superfamily hydrolase